MDASKTPSLDELRDAIMEAIRSSEVCRALEALIEKGWNPSVSVDVTLEPILEEPSGTESKELNPADRVFLNSMGVIAEAPEL